MGSFFAPVGLGGQVAWVCGLQAAVNIACQACSQGQFVGRWMRILRADRAIRAGTAMIRRKLIQIPARIATSARRTHLHLPAGCTWAEAWTELLDRACGPPAAATT